MRCRSFVLTCDQLHIALVPHRICAIGWRTWDIRPALSRPLSQGPSNQSPLVYSYPTSFIALVDDANDLPILYHFRKGPRPCAAVGCLGLLARWLRCWSFCSKPMTQAANTYYMYMSAKLNKSQRNYSITVLECYAAILSIA